MKASVIIYLSVFSTIVSLAQNGPTFTNPILAGFYPDPSICRVGSDYYLVNSTFAYFPGIPVFHSKDLVNWQLIGHVMDRAEQMDLNGLGVSRGIFAPAIRYHNGLFYVTSTLVDAGGNFVVTAKNPDGPWSNPVWIPQINGIDPSMFFDENGKAYIIYNSIAPENKPLYDGHRSIRMYEFDIDSLRVKGEETILINGGTDISKKPIWIEGPHIFQKDGFYYLIAAEGGTGGRHSEVVFRSVNVDGPYVPYEWNPILTQRHLDPQRKHPVTSTGHADFVETQNGEWWSVFLGCRPYEGDFYNTGRETFMAPVKWENGWPIILKENAEVQYHYPMPDLPVQRHGGERFSGNFTLREEFSSELLDKKWMFLLTPKVKWYELQKEKGLLTIQFRPETVSGKNNPSFLGYRQKHIVCSAITAVDFDPRSDNEKAGLIIFQNETHFYFLCKSLKEGKDVIQLFRSHDELIAEFEIPANLRMKKVFIKIESKRNIYSFQYSFDATKWIILKDNVDARFLSTKDAGGFVGSVFGLYATSLGKPCNSTAGFDWFEYNGNDEVYH